MRRGRLRRPFSDPGLAGRRGHRTGLALDGYASDCRRIGDSHQRRYRPGGGLEGLAHDVTPTTRLDDASDASSSAKTRTRCREICFEWFLSDAGRSRLATTMHVRVRAVHDRGRRRQWARKAPDVRVAGWTPADQPDSASPPPGRVLCRADGHTFNEFLPQRWERTSRQPTRRLLESTRGIRANPKTPVTQQTRSRLPNPSTC